MQNINERPAGQKAPGIKTNKKVLAVALIVTVSLAAFAAYIFSETRGAEKQKVTNKEPALYTKLEEYKLEGEGNTGMIFNKPVEFIKTSELKEANSNTTSFVHTKTGGSVGFLTASSLQSDMAGDSSYRDGVNSLMKDGSSEALDKFLAPLKDFVISSTSPKLDVKLGIPLQFKNPYIQENAWQFEVTTQSKPSEKVKVNPVKGILILAIGKKSFNYFGYYTVDYNWGNTEEALIQILKSLRIDQ